METWKKIRLGDACKTNMYSYSPKEKWNFVNYLDTGNITDNKIDSIQYIDVVNEKLPSRARRKVKKDSIIYSTVRPNQHHFGIIKSQPENFLVSTGFAVIDTDSQVLDADFLYYLLTQSTIVESLNAIAEQSTSAYPSIKPSDIENLEIEIPDIATQKKIADVLFSLDKKMAQNMEINKNLEQQARSLFKAWFVDFDPFANTMLSDWKKGKLKDILKLKRQSIKTGENTTLPYLPIDVIPMRTFALTDFKPNAEAQSSLITFDKDDIIIGAMRVYFHRVVLAPCDGITRTTCFTLAPYNNEYLSFALLCCDQESSIDYAQSTSKGSTMPYAIWEGGLGDMEIIIPTPEIAKKFNEIVLPMLRQIQNSYFENNRLREIRNALLPRLMSDEVDVSNLDL